MSFYDLIQSAIDDSLRSSLSAFVPELMICGTIVLLLLARMLLSVRSGGAFLLTLAGAIAALYFAAPWHYLAAGAQLGSGSETSLPAFTGMLVYDKFSIALRGLLLLFVILFTIFARISRIPRDEDATEFFVLVLGATLGMCLMVAANHMLIVFLGVEMASVPSYALSGLLKNRRQSSEAAVKFAVFGGATAGVMLYGISLLAGALGSVQLPTMAQHLAALVQGGLGPERGIVLILGALMVAVGVAFKLSAVPFHFWAPDVFEGASAEVGAFLSVASKTAALGLLARLMIAFSGVEPARVFLMALIGLLAAVTCTYGNLAAYGQTNIKRLLAYSTIAHAGYMMMPMAAAMALVGRNNADASLAVAAMIFYASIYLFMNLGAFAVVAFVRNSSGSEEIDDYAGLVRRSPGVAICFAFILFSLIGVPPAAGFSAKFGVFAALYRADLLGLLAIAALNTVLSLFYYLRIIRAMILLPEPGDRPTATVPFWSSPGIFCLAMTLPLAGFFLWWDGLLNWFNAATKYLF